MRIQKLFLFLAGTFILGALPTLAQADSTVDLTCPERMVQHENDDPNFVVAEVREPSSYSDEDTQVPEDRHIFRTGRWE
jgi:hypothetical protein